MEHELALMEEEFSSLQDKLSAFEQVKELYKVLTDERMRVGVVLNEGMPSAFMIYSAPRQAQKE
jgi:hypothetical protein